MLSAPRNDVNVGAVQVQDEAEALCLTSVFSKGLISYYYFRRRKVGQPKSWNLLLAGFEVLEMSSTK